MRINSVFFYFVLMGGYVLFAWALSRVIPFHRRQNIIELNSRRIASLDGLRGILAITISIIHALEFHGLESTGVWMAVPLQNFWEQLGTFSVTLFFFITGYVFWRKLSNDKGIRLGPFIYARLGRIGFAYWGACIVCFMLAFAVSGFHANRSPGILIVQAVSWLTFVGTAHNLNGIPFSFLWLGPAWTLRFEWLFYFSIPFLGWFAKSRARLPLLFGLSAIAHMILIRIHVSGRAGLVIEELASYTRFLTFTFSVGIIIAVTKFNQRWRTLAQSKIAAAVCIAAIAAIACFLPPVYGWQESLAATLPFCILCLGNTLFGLLDSGPVRFLGRISYSFYLLHVVTFIIGTYLLKRFMPVTSLSPISFWIFTATCGAVAIFVSSFFYQYLEHPFLHIGKTPRKNGTPVYPERRESDQLAGQGQQARTSQIH